MLFKRGLAQYVKTYLYVQTQAALKRNDVNLCDLVWKSVA